MSRRRRTRGRPRRGRTAAWLVVLAGLFLIGTGVPAASFTHGEVPRGSAVNVTSDPEGALGLDTAQAVYINDTSELVSITNRLGQDVTITVALRDDSEHLGNLAVDGDNHGNETTFPLAEGTTERVSIEVPANSSLTDETVYFRVTASEPGLTVTARDRSTPVDG